MQPAKAICGLAEICGKEGSGIRIPSLDPAEDALLFGLHLFAEFVNVRVDHRLVNFEAAGAWVKDEQSPADLTPWQGTKRKINIGVESDADGTGLSWIEGDAHNSAELFDDLPSRDAFGVVGRPEPEVIMDTMKKRAVSVLVDSKVETEKNYLAKHVAECMCTRGTALTDTRFAMFINKPQGSFQEALEEGEPLWGNTKELQHGENCCMGKQWIPVLECGSEASNLSVNSRINGDIGCK